MYGSCAGLSAILLNQRTVTCCRSSTALSVTKVTSRKYILPELLYNVIVVNRRQVTFLNAIKYLSVPYEHKVADVVRTQETVVVEVTRDIFKVSNQVSNTLTDSSTFDTCFLFAGLVTNSSGNVDFNGLSCFLSSRSADVSVERCSIINTLRLTYPAEHYRVKLRERTFSSPRLLGQVVVDSKTDLSIRVNRNCLTFGSIRSMQRKQVLSFRVVTPCRRFKCVRCVIQFSVAVKTTVNSRHFYECGVRAGNIVSEHLLRDNHIIQRSEDSIRFKFTSKFRHN